MKKVRQEIHPENGKLYFRSSLFPQVKIRLEVFSLMLQMNIYFRVKYKTELYINNHFWDKELQY